MACEDITERKRAEEALKESEEKYRLLVENAAEAIFVAQDGMLKFTNRNTTEMIGYSKEELISKPFQEFIHPDDRGLVLDRHLKRLEGHGLPSVYPFRIVNKSGNVKWVELNAVLITWEGRPATLNFLSDITERKEAEEALQESEKKFRVLTETAASGIFIHQGERFIYVNPASETMSGYSREELLALNFWDLVHPDFRELVKQRAQARQQGEPVPSRYELKIITKNGEERWVDLTVGMINFEGKPAILGTDFDITERKRAEEEMRALEEQLRQSQKMEAVGRLAGGIAHDFNNLLTIIKGYSQLSLLDLDESHHLWGNIQEIQKATQRATDLTRQLLAFSRRQILDLKILDLNSLLKDLDKMLRRIIGEDIEPVTLLAEDLGRVKIDPGQMEQVILNLAVNARDAMPSGGKLIIETANVVLDEEYAHAHVGVIPGHYVKLSVSDTGLGMPQEVKEKAFEPFFTTKEKGKGTGLGLSTVYGIVKQSGGNVWVYSEQGHGTTFKIYLPRIEGELDTLRGTDETDSFPGGSETVLLVEDEPLVRDTANRLLKQQGYRVFEAANGEEALRVAHEHNGDKIHLLLTDVVMPQMGGKELADQLKIMRPDVKVLYTSGYTDDAIVHHGVLDPGTHFLQKPFSIKTLSQKVREALDR
jgi:PAS domain S-box-containing protein